MAKAIWNLALSILNLVLIVWASVHCIIEENRGHKEMSLLWLLVALVLGVKAWKP